MIATRPAVCPLCPEAPRKPVGAGVDFEYRTCPDTFTFVRCEGCGTLLLDPRPADEAIGPLYPPDYQPYRFDDLPGPVRRARDLVQKKKVDLLKRVTLPDARIVDVGCGSGGLLRLMRRYGPATWRLAGWDFPGVHLDKAEADGFEVYRGGVEAGLLPDASVDLFVLNQVIEHFPEPRRVLEVLRAALRPGGLVLIETPNVEGWDARLFGGRYWGGYHFPRHMVLFTAKSLERLLCETGFDVVETGSLTSPAFWVQSVHHAATESRRWRWVAPLLTVSNPLLLAGATLLDLARLPFGPTSNLRVLARRGLQEGV